MGRVAYKYLRFPFGFAQLFAYIILNFKKDDTTIVSC